MATDSFICCGVKRWRETETLYLFTYFYFLTVSTYTVYWLSVNCRRYYPCPFPSYTGCYWSDTEGDYQYFFHPTFPIYYLLVVATNELGSTKTTFQQSTSDIGRASQRAYIADKFIMYTIINLFYTARLRLIHIWLVIVYFCALLFAYGYWYILVCFLFFFLSYLVSYDVWPHRWASHPMGHWLSGLIHEKPTLVCLSLSSQGIDTIGASTISWSKIFHHIIITNSVCYILY